MISKKKQVSSIVLNSLISDRNNVIYNEPYLKIFWDLYITLQIKLWHTIILNIKKFIAEEF